MDHTMERPLIEVCDLQYSHDTGSSIKLDHLEIARGEIFVILGPNGAGKSTVLRILGLLERPARGQLRWEGAAVEDPPGRLDLRRKISMVLQEPCLFDMKVKDNIAYGLRIRGVKDDVIKGKVREMMELFSIAPLEDREPGKLSGGERHRVSLARALAVGPELLLLDEPFSSLDFPSREALREEIRSIMKSRLITSVFVTHDRAEALFMADRIAIIDRGEILQIGSPEEVFNCPASERVASFVGVDTILPGRIDSFADGMLRIKVGERVLYAASTKEMCGNALVCIRPEEVILYRSESEIRTSARNSYRATITKVTNLGGVFKVYLDAGFSLVSLITGQAAGELELKEHDKIFAQFKAHSVHVIEKK